VYFGAFFRHLCEDRLSVRHFARNRLQAREEIASLQLSVEKTLAFAKVEESENGNVDATEKQIVTTLHLTGEAKLKQGEDGMKEQTVRLGPREQQIVDLLLQGCDNAEIATQLNMARRTEKAHINRLFLRFGITGGIKRVNLATQL
jgi:DNA-binding NarL/FixJ family response regulator